MLMVAKVSLLFYKCSVKLMLKKQSPQTFDVKLLSSVRHNPGSENQSVSSSSSSSVRCSERILYPSERQTPQAMWCNKFISFHHIFNYKRGVFYIVLRKWRVRHKATKVSFSKIVLGYNTTLLL